MSNWTERESKFLQDQWQRGSTSLRLPAACPHCGHAGAFAELVIYDVSVDDGFADGGPADEGRGPLGGGGGGGRSRGFPPHATVVCKCGHGDHAPAKGCGRDGNVSTGLG